MTSTAHRVLFVLKERENPYGDVGWGDCSSGHHLSSGLFNSARMVCDMLQDAGIETKLVHVVDNNAIHKEIVAFVPTDVIIEAFWVVPEKFDELAQACPDVRFIVRNHSEAPFLANEGIAFGWTLDYAARPNVAISCNALRMLEETRELLTSVHADWPSYLVSAKTPFLPNYYPLALEPPRRPLRDKDQVDVGCFGAVRPLKNHMLQALAAMRFADGLGKVLRFHINAGRVEGAGDPILKNLREVFARHPRHELVEQPWRPHDDFRRVIAQMDLVTAVSFTETFCIVAADAISQGVATVVSSEISWASAAFSADPTSSSEIAERMDQAYRIKQAAPTHNPSLAGLVDYNAKSRAIWLSEFAA